MTNSSHFADDLTANPCLTQVEQVGLTLVETTLEPLSAIESERVERLIARHRPLLRRLCKAQLPQREDAEDLEGICVMSACRRFASYDPGRGAFGTWLGTIVRNEASDWRRRVSRQPVCVPSDNNTEHTISQAIAKTYEASDLPELPELSRLPDLLRQAFVLVKLGGLSSAEAATAMGTTDGTVRTYVWKARQLLRAWCFSDFGRRSALVQGRNDECFGVGEEGLGG